ncbi:MAG: hypothetical protein SFV19_06510 [Rhodospirillaceae bacterium]|nr:hypothetical protein [Rhodospirillaceae bacterium]
MAPIPVSRPYTPALAVFSTDALLQWRDLARANLKAEQRRLAARRVRLVLVRTARLVNADLRARALDLATRDATWALYECRAARAELAALEVEIARRRLARPALARRGKSRISFARRHGSTLLALEKALCEPGRSSNNARANGTHR